MYKALTIDNRVKDTLRIVSIATWDLEQPSAWRSSFTPSKWSYCNIGVTETHIYYYRLKSFSLQPLRSILMKIGTLHLSCVSGDSTASFIPSCNGRLGDKHESRHSFDVSVKNKHWKPQCMTAIYSSWQPLKMHLQQLIWNAYCHHTRNSCKHTEINLASIFLSATAVLTLIRQTQGSCCHLHKWWTEKCNLRFSAWPDPTAARWFLGEALCTAIHSFCCLAGCRSEEKQLLHSIP